MSVRLFVLGVVFEHDCHGYEIKETARLWGLEQWASIGVGSIYHALSRLDSEGLIEQRGVEQQGARPPRAVYRVTLAGRAAFLELLRECCRTAPAEGRSIDLALAFIANLPPDERRTLLRERHSMLEAKCRVLSDRLERRSFEGTHIPWVIAAMRHTLHRLESEIIWNGSLLESVADWPRRTWPSVQPPTEASASTSDAP